MSQTERLYWIDAQIRSGQYPNAQAVCERFGVRRRTAYADRDYLVRKLHAPLVYDRTHDGWTYTDTTFTLPFLVLSRSEAAGLRRALLAAQEYLGAADARALALITERLAPHLSALTRETVGGAIRLSGSVSVAEALLDACERAVTDRHRLHILYDGAHRGEITDRVIRPYHLHNARGEWYLIAYCELRQDFRTFFLGRIREYELLQPDCAFTRDPGFTLEEHLMRAFGMISGEKLVTVRARFSPYQARWIRERQYHPSQEVEEQPDGSLMVTLRVAGTVEIGRWLKGYGAEVEVLEPPSLREEIAAEAKKLTKIYSAGRECSDTALAPAILEENTEETEPEIAKATA
jgi:predicted DNA-binding transcriptional regulator YafY